MYGHMPVAVVLLVALLLWLTLATRGPAAAPQPGERVRWGGEALTDRAGRPAHHPTRRLAGSS